MMHAVPLASGSYLPSRAVTNADLEKLFPTSDAWIREHVGVETRHFAAPEEGVSDLALNAAREALKKATLKPTDIDAILFATTTPEFKAPGSGVLLQDKLGCRDIPAIDVRNTSPGFLFALDLADGLIRSERYRTVLVVGAEVHSRHLDFSEKGRKMAVIFGDGAGCLVLRGEKSQKGLRDFVLHSDGAHARKLWCEKDFPDMDGKFVFQNAVSRMGGAIREILTKNRLTPGDVDFVLSHQANARILETLQQEFKFCDGKIPRHVEKYGNTSAASIPILFDELSREGRIREGQKIILVSFGSGFSWGAGFLAT